MSQEREIELDVDAVFPPPGARSGMVRKPDADLPPLPALPPPAPTPAATRVLERIQEDVDLVIEATSRRLDDMGHRIESFEQALRGLVGAQERRIRELEQQLVLAHHRIAEVVADHDRLETRAHALHARTAVAMARIETLEHAEVLRRELVSSPSGALSAAEDQDSRESTQKIIRD